MSSFALIEENMELPHVHLAVTTVLQFFIFSPQEVSALNKMSGK